MPLVIDANVAVAWFGKKPDRLATRALDEIERDGGLVPPLWRYEVQDVLRRMRKAGQLAVKVEDALAELRQLPIAIADAAAGLFGNEYALAVQHGLSVYDAAYLDLAIQRGVALVTLDRRLAAASRVVGRQFP